MRTVSTFLVASIILSLSAWAVRLYGRRWYYGSFEEILALGRIYVLATSALILSVTLLHAHLSSQLLTLLGATLGLVTSLSARVAWRLKDARHPQDATAAQDRLLIFGAGRAGAHIVRILTSTNASGFKVVGLLDDDPYRQRFRIRDVPVLGTRASLAEIARDQQADSLLLAIPSASTDTLQELARLGAEAGLRVHVMPSVREIVAGRAKASDIRPVNVTDLLGRRPIHLEEGLTKGYLAGRRVLITGAGGSIGSELCRQVAACQPSQLLMLDRDESALHAVQLTLEGRALLDSPDLILADIRDAERMRDVFERHRPEIVFHAAAAKHLPLLEMHPAEGLKTNIWGTQNVLRAARLVGVERFVNISTDKAANPVSVLGFTKRVAERIVAHHAAETGRPFVSVRFGNVLGSRGSVLTAFEAQIDAGTVITITDPEVTRYFMMVEEAVELTLLAGAIGTPGQVLILDMGEPVRIADLARRLAAQRGCSIELEFTGLRPGEKLHEHLIGDGERDDRPTHPLITQTFVPPLHPAQVLAVDPYDPCLRHRLIGLTTEAFESQRDDPNHDQSLATPDLLRSA